MPWKVEHKPKKNSNRDWAIMKQEGNGWKVVGRSTSKKKAQESVRARYASENK